MAYVAAIVCDTAVSVWGCTDTAALPVAVPRSGSIHRRCTRNRWMAGHVVLGGMVLAEGGAGCCSVEGRSGGVQRGSCMRRASHGLMAGSTAAVRGMPNVPPSSVAVKLYVCVCNAIDSPPPPRQPERCRISSLHWPEPHVALALCFLPRRRYTEFPNQVLGQPGNSTAACKTTATTPCLISLSS